MYCGDDVSSVVLDIGSYNIRTGYSGEDCPRSVIPSYVGQIGTKDARRKGLVGRVGLELQDADGDVQMADSEQKIVVGSSAISHRRDGMEINNMYDSDGQLNFDYLDEIIEETLSKGLKVNIQETPILFTENAIHKKDLRMQLTEYMFEKYKIPALFLVKDPVLTAFSCGRSSALILDCGHKSTIATPVNDGYALLKCIIKHDIGGEQLTRDLYNFIVHKKQLPIKPRYTFTKKFINVDGAEMLKVNDLSDSPSIQNTTSSFADWSKMEIVREMKEDFLSVSDEFLQQKLSDQARIAQYELPDGSQIQMSSFERQNIGEKLFLNQSSLALQAVSENRDASVPDISGFSGVHQMIVESISKSDIDMRRDLFTNIITSGGTTMFKGFQERVQKQLPEISPQNVKVKVLSSNDRRFQPWIGGSILSSLGSFQQMWMSRQEFEEHGSIMIERKCP